MHYAPCTWESSFEQFATGACLRLLLEMVLGSHSQHDGRCGHYSHRGANRLDQQTTSLAFTEL